MSLLFVCLMQKTFKCVALLLVVMFLLFGVVVLCAWLVPWKVSETQRREEEVVRQT